MCSIHQQKLHSIKLFKNYNQDKKILNITSIRLKYYSKISLPCLPCPSPPPPPAPSGPTFLTPKIMEVSKIQHYQNFFKHTGSQKQFKGKNKCL